MLEINRLYCGDAAKLLKEVDSNVCDLTVTSPVYDRIRKYDGFTFTFENIAHQLFRVTKNGGIVVWVVGDQTVDGDETGTAFKQALYFKHIGFKLYDTMIYHKSGFNFPANNRYHQVFEYIFVLSKGKPKTFNPLVDRKNKYVGQKAHGRHRGHDENDYKDMSKIVKAKPIGEYGKRTNVWYYKVGGGNVTKDKIAYQHPAIFPDALAEDCIKSWSNSGDLVLDPMVGSGTTCKMAKLLGRNFIGIDVSEKYIKLAEERLRI